MAATIAWCPMKTLADQRPASYSVPLGAEDHGSEASKTILELQQFRQTNSIRILTKAGRTGVATLVNLNPTINAWYLLQLAWPDGSAGAAYHLENPAPQRQKDLRR